MAKRSPAREKAQDRGNGVFWIDHATIVGTDRAWLEGAERMTLWNVVVPDGFLADLPKLWWLDLRGGTASDLRVARGCAHLRYLQVNQVRGLGDLGALSEHASLELLSLYGLAQVRTLPSLRSLTKLKRMQIGQMRNLPMLGAALDAPHLEELLLSKRVGVSESDLERINSHPAIKAFYWNVEDVAASRFEPILARIALPSASVMHPEAWMGVPR
ncbi:MAG: hypothetical protein HOO96_16465 [Polyangiaceae bacterium]|nr:hypothetical protein [Polyangiaceae bacterium]